MRADQGVGVGWVANNLDKYQGDALFQHQVILKELTRILQVFLANWSSAWPCTLKIFTLRASRSFLFENLWLEVGKMSLQEL